MRKIYKQQAPHYFAQLAAEQPDGWEATRPVSYMLRKHILEVEQDHLCAFTELRLYASSSSSHIDHFRKRSLFPELTFDYRNLMVSCNLEFCGAKFKDRRIVPEDYRLLINPTREDPADHLTYSFTGRIIPRRGSPKGERTISLLNLNHRALVEHRKAIAYALISPRYRSLDEKKVLRSIGEMESFTKTIFRRIRREASPS